MDKALELADEFQNRQNWKLLNYIHWSEQSETMLRQQEVEIERITSKYEEILHEQHAEIEALKAENRVLRKGELWLGMVYNNRGEGIAPMYLENFMRFCEENGFTEECGYKLFKAQE